MDFAKKKNEKKLTFDLNKGAFEDKEMFVDFSN